MFFAREVYGTEGAKVLAGFPADLLAKTGGVAGSLDVAKLAQEPEEDRLEEVPIFGATGKESAKPQFFAITLVDIDDGEIALAAGGNVEAKTELALGLKQFEETFVNEISDFLFAIALAGRTELTELFDDLTVLEVDTDECVIVATAFDDGPVHDVVGGGAERVAHVALLVDFFLTSARLAISEELGAAKLSAASAVDDVHEAELNGVGHGDAEVNVPRRIESRWLRVEGQGALTLDPSPIRWERGTVCRILGAGRGTRTSGAVRSAGGAGFLSKFIEQSVFAVVGGPDGQIVDQRNAA